MNENDRRAREDEADLLAQIGQHLFGQDLRVTVRLPASLAGSALAAWERDDTGDVEAETDAGRTTRHHAGALALIGLAVQDRGASREGEQVEVALDAWQIGTALDAADQRGLLAGLEPPYRNA